MTDAHAVPREDRVIRQLASHLPPSRQTRLGIGDDAAVVEPRDGTLLLITTDLLMDNVHFRVTWGDIPSIGWKALAHNLSDIAAMGGVPTHAVIALAIPPTWRDDQIAALYQGMRPLAESAGVDIVGGDTVASSGPLTLCVTVTGRVRADALLTRAGAHPGDAIYVTGTLGRAAAGLRVLDAGIPIPRAWHPLRDAQLRPHPRLDAAAALAETRLVTAMMDLSDGVATDLHRLCRASGVGARLDARSIPIDVLVTRAAPRLSTPAAPCDALRLALAGGEDFELLLTAPAEYETPLREAIRPLPLTRIGHITAALGVVLEDANGPHPLDWGFTHLA